METADRFRRCFSVANAVEPARGWRRETTQLAGKFLVLLHPIGALERVNIYDIASRVETITPRIRPRRPVTPPATHTQTQYRYCDTEFDGRNSENSCTYCGNLTTSNFRTYCSALKNKHLDTFRNGTLLANRVVTRSSTYVLVSE